LLNAPASPARRQLTALNALPASLGRSMATNNFAGKR
jgi:hypothetical protein